MISGKPPEFFDNVLGLKPAIALLDKGQGTRYARRC
jgi:hypothetical protein